MQKTLLASAIALTLGTATTAQAAVITITNMTFNGSYAASGTMNSSSTGVMNSVDLFFSAPWTATQQTWFDTHTSLVTWAGTAEQGAYSYTFHLTSNQVAAGTFFDWAGNNGIPVLTIYDCGVTGPSSCAGVSEPMQTGPFPNQKPAFNGTTNDDFPVSGGGVVPVPAAVWLFGSGLVGLVGVARRRKQA